MWQLFLNKCWQRIKNVTECASKTVSHFRYWEQCLWGRWWRRTRPSRIHGMPGIVDTPPTLAYHSKYETLTQCWFNVGPPSMTTAQHWISIGSMPRVCWDVCLFVSCLHMSLSLFKTATQTVPALSRLYSSLWDEGSASIQHRITVSCLLGWL